MAEATEEKVETVDPEKSVVETEVDEKVDTQVDTSVTTETDDDREPGGADGAAVYARRKNREAKAAREAFEVEREARIRLEEQLAAAKQTREEKTQKVFTPEEVQAEIDAGRLSPALGAAYLARTETQRVMREERALEQARKPIEAALQRISEYREVLDWTNDRTHPNFLKAQVKFRELVARGSPANEATELTALEFIAGDLDVAKKRYAMRETSRTAGRPAPADVGNGGGGSPQRSTDVTTKVPRELIDGWKRMGANDEQLKKYAQHHLDRQAKRRGMAGG